MYNWHLMDWDVIVIGGGASGMMAAGKAGELGKRVLLLEKNKYLGEKLKISGGGRCNVTNEEQDMKKFLSHYGPAEKFLYSVFSQYNNNDTFAFFESRGLPLIVQALKRAFPNTEKAIDVFNVMDQYLKESKVTVKVSSPVTKIISENGRIKSVVAGGVEYYGKSFVFATGGLSHPETGSTGDGFKWLNDLGHTVAKPTPSIVPMAVSDAWIKSIAGTTIDIMKITFFVDEVKSFSKKGRILFTHFGLSGPLILNSAKAVGDLLHEGIVTATIDLFPELDLGSLEKKMIEIFDANKNKMLKNIFSDLVPARIALAILTLLKEVNPDTKVHSVTKDERKQIVRLIKALPVSITGLMGFDRAVVADGGIPLSEIDMKTMQSLKIKNLFITGDLLHINRPSGGFSLQLCWTTGYVAGKNA